MLWVLLVDLGCSRAGPLQSPTAERMRGLATVYLDYAVAKGAGPPHQESLQQHVQNLPPFMLGASGLDQSDNATAFVSERDGRPFLIQYGVAISQSKGLAAPPIILEQIGKDGKRLIVFANGELECIAEDTAKALKIASGARPFKRKSP